jgi:hypothetical protein
VRKVATKFRGLGRQRAVDIDFTGLIGNEIPFISGTTRELLHMIRACHDYLLDPMRTESEIGSSNEWLRKSANKGALRKLCAEGFKIFEGELNPALVGSYLKKLLRSIPGDLINLENQNVIISLMNNVDNTNASLPDPVLQFLQQDAERYEIISLIGNLARFIFANCKVPIAPENLAKVISVHNFVPVTLLIEAEGPNTEWFKTFGAILTRLPHQD